MEAQALCSSFNGRNIMGCIEIIMGVKTLRLINLPKDRETVSQEWNPNFSSLSCVNTMPSWGPGASLVAQLVKNPPAMQETPV